MYIALSYKVWGLFVTQQQITNTGQSSLHPALKTTWQHAMVSHCYRAEQIAELPKGKFKPGAGDQMVRHYSLNEDSQGKDSQRRCWRRFLTVPWTTRRSNQSILKEINPEYSQEGLMLKLNFQYFGHLKRKTESLEKTLMLGKIEGGRKRGQQRRRVG